MGQAGRNAGRLSLLFQQSGTAAVDTIPSCPHIAPVLAAGSAQSRTDATFVVAGALAALIPCSH